MLLVNTIRYVIFKLLHDTRITKYITLRAISFIAILMLSQCNENGQELFNIFEYYKSIQVYSCIYKLQVEMLSHSLSMNRFTFNRTTLKSGYL